MIKRNPPLVEQVRQNLLSKILLGEMESAEGKLPSETELAELYGVSRSSVRLALSALQDAGMIARRQGKGTYVNELGIPPGSVWGWLDEAITFSDLIKASGSTPNTILLELEIIEAGISAPRLKTDSHEQVIRIAKVVCSDSRPIIYSDTKTPLRIFGQNRPDLLEIRDCCTESIYQLLKDHSKFDVHHQTSRIMATRADGLIARRLEYGEGLPLLCLEEVGYSVEQLPLYHARHCFRADCVSFLVVRRPLIDISESEKQILE